MFAALIEDICRALSWRKAVLRVRDFSELFPFGTKPGLGFLEKRRSEIKSECFVFIWFNCKSVVLRVFKILTAASLLWTRQRSDFGTHATKKKPSTIGQVIHQTIGHVWRLKSCGLLLSEERGLHQNVKGDYKPAFCQTKEDSCVGLSTAEQGESLARNGGGRFFRAKQDLWKMAKVLFFVFIGVCWVRLTDHPSLTQLPPSPPPCSYSLLTDCFLCQMLRRFPRRVLNMRVDVLQSLVLVLLSVGGSAVSSDCKSYDERSKSAGKSLPTDRKVVCSNMELHQVLPPDSFPNRTVTLWVQSSWTSYSPMSTTDCWNSKTRF